MIEIGSYLWFGGAVGITGEDQLLTGKLYLANKATSNFTAGAVVNVDRRSFLTSDGGTDTAGHWELGGSGQAHAIIPPICLVNPNHGSGASTSAGNNEYCGLVSEWYKEDGTSLHNGPSGHGLRSISSGAVKDIGLAIISVKYDSNNGVIENWTRFGNQESDAYTYGGRCLGVIRGSSITAFTIQNSSNAEYTDVAHCTAYDHDTNYGTNGHATSLSVATAKDISRGRLVTIANSSNHDYHLFAGKGVGRWMSLINQSTASNDFTARLESNVKLLMQENSIASSLHENNKKYYYKVSFVYDGYQESPLSDFTDILSTGKQIQITLEY